MKYNINYTILRMAPFLSRPLFDVLNCYRKCNSYYQSLLCIQCHILREFHGTEISDRSQNDVPVSLLYMCFMPLCLIFVQSQEVDISTQVP